MTGSLRQGARIINLKFNKEKESDHVNVSRETD